MNNRALISVLRQIDLTKCDEIIPGKAFFIKKTITLKCTDGRRYKSKGEFIVLANEGNIVGGIYLMGEYDLHAYIFKKYRGNHYLSDFLRTGMLKKVAPYVKKASCCDEEYNRFKHFMAIAGLEEVSY